MKILQVISSLGSGGAERFVVDLSNELSKDNEVYILTWNKSGNNDFYRSQISERVHQIALDKGQSLWAKICLVFTVIRIIRTLKPDTVHAHCKGFPFIIVPSLIYRKTRYFYTVHNLAPYDTKPGISTSIRKIFLNINIHAVTISKICSVSFLDYYGYKDYAVIENGCRELHTTNALPEVKQEIDGYKISPNTKVCVNVARITKEKNHLMLVQVFNDLIDEGNDVILLMFGYTKGNPTLTKQIENSIKYPDRIKLMGTRTNIPDYLHEADYFCMPSLWEGLPISMLEAGMSGVYPIATPVGGIPDVIKNEHWGLLAKDTSKEAFKRQVEKGLKMNIDRRQLATLYDSNYSMRNCAKRYLEIYK